MKALVAILQMRMLLAGVLFLVLGCSHAVASKAPAREAARAALNAIDPNAELRIAFGPQLGAKTESLFSGLRPPARLNGADTLTYLPAGVLRIDEFTVVGDNATFKGRRGPVPRPALHTLDCGTGYTLTLQKSDHGWVVLQPITLMVC